jgi:hypothetical protein
MDFLLLYSLPYLLHSLHQSRVQLLEEERLYVTAQLASKKEEAASSLREIDKLRDMLSSFEQRLKAKEAEATASKDAMMQLEMEKELRSRSERREEDERRERIAANAQLMAIQTECNRRMEHLEAKHTDVVNTITSEKASMQLRMDELSIALQKEADIHVQLGSEVQELKHALEHASANHETIENLGRVTGELEVLKRKYKEVTESQVFISLFLFSLL